MRAADAPRVWAAIAALLLVISVLAIALAWKTDQRVASLEQELVRRQQASSAQAAEARMLAGQAQEGLQTAAAKVALLEARVAEVAVQRGQLEDLIQSLSRSRDENLLVDVEAALRVALQQGAITGSAEPLVSTLRQADERLARYNQPRLEGVRRAIARDLDRVKAVGTTDISALTLKLDEAMRMVDELPLLSSAEPRGGSGNGNGVGKPAAAASAAKGDAAPTAAATAPGLGQWPQTLHNAWSGLVDTIGAELRSLVRVTRIEHPEGVLVAPEQAYFLRENLKLRLLNARVALLSRQFTLAQADLQVAESALDRYFDRSARRTTTVIDLVKQVSAQSRQVALPRPDQTLAALTAAAAGR